MKKLFKDVRFYFMGIYAILNIVFIVQMFIAKMIPMKYIILAIIVQLLLFVAMYFLQYAKRTNKINKVLGKILIVLLSALLCVGNLYLFKTYNTFSTISGDDTKTTQVSVVVMKDSSYKSIKDLKDASFGTITIGETTYTDKTMAKIEKEVDQSIAIVEYNGFDVFAEALYTKEVDAIILNEGYRGMFEDNHPDFEKDTKVIKTYTYEEKTEKMSKSVKVTDEPFVVYISGIDTYGSISTVSRTDVNKMMVVNPTSKQILLIDIPRDYYIPQVCQSYQEDKLTHTGIFGVDCTVQSVSEYFDEDINYYMRVNFSSLVDIVDALGGVNVTSEYVFSAQGFNFIAGNNNLSGEEALAFSRERYSLSGGDNERIKNQSRVLSGIINKATSPSIITNYMSVMNAIGGTFQTNMSDSEIASLVSMQLDDMSGWNISDYAVNGTGGTDWTPANGFNAYVMYPNKDSVAVAKQLISQVKNGETPVVPMS